MHAIIPISSLDSLVLDGQWIHDNETRSVMTSWAGSSISFIFVGTKLKLICGKRTERKDKWNGGVSMLGISINSAQSSTPMNWNDNWETFDAEPGSVFRLIENENNAQTEVLVTIMMIDWASLFELEAFVVDETATIHKPSVSYHDRILFIGDSISCGYFVQPNGEPIPGPTSRGCLDAFPWVAQRILLEGDPSYHFQVDLVAYPGWTLVSPSDAERASGNPLGMLKSYYQPTPWDTTSWYDHKYSARTLGVVIELGTNDQEYYSVARYKADMNSFLQSITREMCFKPRYIWPPFPDGDQPTELQRQFPILIEELRTDFPQLEICDINSCLEITNTIDGIHPTIQGHKKLGLGLARFIQAHLATSEAPAARV